MVTIEQIKDLKTDDIIYWKNLYLFPEMLKIKRMDKSEDKYIIVLEDDIIIPEKNFDNVFLTEKECIEDCQKELNQKIEKLRLMLKTSK